jgi:hypothetical protein
MESIDLTQFRAGYDIIKKEIFKDNLYDLYMDLICDEIIKNNIRGVNGLIRYLDLIGYFPDNNRMFNVALKHGSFEMFLMIYYICLFWNNENDLYQYLENLKIENLNYLYEYDFKLSFLKDIYKQHGKFHIGMDNVAEQALTENDNIDTIYENQENAFEKSINNALIPYDINMKEINTQFHESEHDRYNELSS